MTQLFDLQLPYSQTEEEEDLLFVRYLICRDLHNLDWVNTKCQQRHISSRHCMTYLQFLLMSRDGRQIRNIQNQLFHISNKQATHLFVSIHFIQSSSCIAFLSLAFL